MCGVSSLRPPLLIAVRERRSGCHRRIDPLFPRSICLCGERGGEGEALGVPFLWNDRSRAIGRCTEEGLVFMQKAVDMEAPTCFVVFGVAGGASSYPSLIGTVGRVPRRSVRRMAWDRQTLPNICRAKRNTCAVRSKGHECPPFFPPGKRKLTDTTCIAYSVRK